MNCCSNFQDCKLTSPFSSDEPFDESSARRKQLLPANKQVTHMGELSQILTPNPVTTVAMLTSVVHHSVGEREKRRKKQEKTPKGRKHRGGRAFGKRPENENINRNHHVLLDRQPLDMFSLPWMTPDSFQL